MSAQENNPMNLTFENGNQAKAALADLSEPVPQLIQKLGLTPPYKVILITGSAAPLSESAKKRVLEVFDQGLAATVDAKTVIIDGATQEGVVELIGANEELRQRRPVLLGVAPRGKIYLPESQEDRAKKHPLDANHTHFVLAPGDHWQAATRLMFDLAEALATPAPITFPQPCELPPPKLRPRLVMLMVGGSEDNVSLDEALLCAQKGWQLVVVEGSGRLADKIARALQASQRLARTPGWLRPLLTRLQRRRAQGDGRFQELIQTGKIQIFARKSQPKELKSSLKEQLDETRQENILHQAWRRYTLYSHNAKRNQKFFYRFRNLALWLAWLTTLAVLLQPVLKTWAGEYLDSTAASPLAQWVEGWLKPALQALVPVLPEGEPTPLENGIRFVVVALPILTSLLLTAESYTKAGNKYVALRASAEAVLGGIYSYRMLACCGRANILQGKRPSSAADLQTHLRKVITRLAQSEISDAALQPSPEPTPPRRFRKMGDDGFSAMNGETYVQQRLLEQLNYFRETTNKLERAALRYRWLIWIVGGLGTLLAALEQEYWLPLTAGAVTAFSAYLEYRQVEQVLLAGNQSEAALSIILAWWVSLTEAQRSTPENVARLLNETETVIESNVVVWVQQMQSAQEKLTQES